MFLLFHNLDFFSYLIILFNVIIFSKIECGDDITLYIHPTNYRKCYFVIEESLKWYCQNGSF